MSGGSLNYFYAEIESHVGDFGDKELDDLVKDIADLFYAREWFLSGDRCEGTWREARNKFKKKWLSDGSRNERIKEYIELMKSELLDSFCVTENYCKNCVHWTQEEDTDSPYGKCDITKGCLMHRSEDCEKFCADEKRK